MSLKNLLSFIWVLTLIVSCKKTTVKTDNLFKFKNYINYTTTGRVSVLSPLEIGLVKDVEGWTVNEEVLDNIFLFHLKLKAQLLQKILDQ